MPALFLHCNTQVRVRDSLFIGQSRPEVCTMCTQISDPGCAPKLSRQSYNKVRLGDMLFECEVVRLSATHDAVRVSSAVFEPSQTASCVVLKRTTQMLLECHAVRVECHA